MISKVSDKIPVLHCEAYTVPDLLCQKIMADKSLLVAKSRIARASGSEKTSVPALTVFVCQVLSGFQLQSKLRLRSTLLALKRPGAVSASFGISSTVNPVSYTHLRAHET